MDMADLEAVIDTELAESRAHEAAVTEVRRRREQGREQGREHGHGDNQGQGDNQGDNVGLESEYHNSGSQSGDGTFDKKAKKDNDGPQGK